jgi:hypothetical protein
VDERRIGVAFPYQEAELVLFFLAGAEEQGGGQDEERFGDAVHGRGSAVGMTSIE